MTTATGKTYKATEYRGWQIMAARAGLYRWEAFAKPPGDEHGPYTIRTGEVRGTTEVQARDRAIKAAETRIDERMAERG